MRIKRAAALFVCICICFSLFPLRIYAMAADQIAEVNAERKDEQTNSIGEIGGYLAGNGITTSKLFAEHQFSYKTGFGFAAERGNNFIDSLKGMNTSVVGGDNVKNGPDRMIINRDGSITWIQDKYYSSARGSVNAAFDKETGLYRYLDGDGNPMQLEVPSDQYDEAVVLMRRKIEQGSVAGVQDPDEASKLVRKGNLSYKQAVNIAKAGTIDSLVYDAANGVISAGCAAGIGFVIDYTCCILNGADPKTALKNAGLNGLKTGGVVFATYVISSQLSKTSLKNALVPTAEAITKALGEDVCEAIVSKTGIQFAGMAATKQVAQIISSELIVDGVVLIVLTGMDVVELFRGRISKEELLKNLTVSVISIAAGTAGGYGGAVLGGIVAQGAGAVIGAAVGSLLAGSLTAWAAEAMIAPYYESDAEEMFTVISQEFTVLCGEYLVNEEEGKHITESLRAKLVGDVLKDMYASEDRQKFARELIEPLFVKEVSQRSEIAAPTAEALRNEMKTALRGIVFIH